MMDRSGYRAAVERALRRAPVTALLGPRQCGKTTLARELSAERPSHFFDLESPRDQLRLQNPESQLERLDGLIVLDEIQARPDLFPVLRVLADRSVRTRRFLLLGSASPELVRYSAQTLAGRVEFVHLQGFDLSETGDSAWHRLWIRGGFPRAYLARSERDSAAWRENFIQTFLTRDLPQMGVAIPVPALRRFWTMLAHYHGQTWNASEIGRSMGLSDKTVRTYLDVMSHAYMVRQLQPWFANTGKRQIKAPKIYVRDTGLLHALLALDNDHAVQGHPKVGASWEGFALEQVLRLLRTEEAYFWGSYQGAEIDLLIPRNGRFTGFEFKFADVPRVTPSMRTALDELSLDRLWIVNPGRDLVHVEERISVCGIQALPRLVTAGLLWKGAQA